MSEIVIPFYPITVKIAVPGVSAAPGASGITQGAADLRYVKQTQVDLSGGNENDVLTDINGVAVWRGATIPLASTNW